MYKFDLKDAYFCEFQLERSNLSVSLPLCLFAFHLGLAPKIFTKLLKVSIFLMRKLNVRLLIFLDDFLLITSSVRGSIWARNTLIYLIQNLDFQVNIKQTVLQPYQTIHCLGMEINSINMTITLLQEKKDQRVKQYQDLLSKSSVSIWELAQLIWRLASTAMLVLLASLQHRGIRRQHPLD